MQLDRLGWPELCCSGMALQMAVRVGRFQISEVATTSNGSAVGEDIEASILAGCGADAGYNPSINPLDVRCVRC